MLPCNVGVLRNGPMVPFGKSIAVDFGAGAPAMYARLVPALRGLNCYISGTISTHRALPCCSHSSYFSSCSLTQMDLKVHNCRYNLDKAIS